MSKAVTKLHNTMDMSSDNMNENERGHYELLELIESFKREFNSKLEIIETIVRTLDYNSSCIGWSLPKIYESNRLGLGFVVIGDRRAGKTVFHTNMLEVYRDGDAVVLADGLDREDVDRYEKAGAMVFRGDDRYAKLPRELKNPYFGFEDVTGVDRFIMNVAAAARHSDLEMGKGTRDFGLIVHKWEIVRDLIPYIDVVVVMRSGSFVGDAFKLGEEEKMFKFARKLAKDLPKYHYFLIDRQRQAISGYIKNDDVDLIEKIVKGKVSLGDFYYHNFTEINGENRGAAISKGMKRYHERKRRERIETGNLCKRDMFRIAIEELYEQDMSYDKITGKIVVEYVRRRFGTEIDYNENVSRDISRLKRSLKNKLK